MQFILNTKSPFNLATVTNSHGWVQLAPFTRHEDGIGFDYVLELDNGQVIEMSVTAVSPKLNTAITNDVQITTHAELDESAQTELKEKAAWMLGIDQNFTDFYTAIAHEPKLASVPVQAQGRLLRSPTLFENIVKIILTTNTTWGGTIRMAQGLAEAYGAPLVNDTTRFAFPTAERLAQASLDVLQGIVKLGYRAPYVLDLAQRVAAGELDVEAWKTAPSASSGQVTVPTNELRKQILALKGVGPYAAAHLLMFLGHYDTVPVDSMAIASVSAEWHDGQLVTKKDVNDAFKKWGQWQALAYWFWDWDETQ